MTVRRTPLLAAAVLVVALVGGVVAGVRGIDHHHKVEAGPPLSAPERQELTAAGPIVLQLQAAISEVPTAASDATHGQVSVATATSRIGATPALVALTQAGTTIALITKAYRAAADGGSIPPDDQLAVAVNQLSAIEGDVLPAVRVAAATGGKPLAATTALEAIERDQQTAALGALLSNWPQIYGALTLLEQAAPQN